MLNICVARVGSHPLHWCWHGVGVVLTWCRCDAGMALAWCWCGIRSSRTSQFGSQMYSVRKAGRQGGGIRWDPSPSNTTPSPPIAKAAQDLRYLIEAEHAPGHHQ